MNANRHVTLFHAPHTRSTGALILLKELNADYHLQVLNFKVGEHRNTEYLAINPMGKVPALMHSDVLITEQVAIFLYLSDLYSEAKLAPEIGDPLRGSYLRWMVFYGSCFEPAIVDRALKREPGAQGMSPYGDYDTTFKTLIDQLSRGEYFLGDTFTSLDLLWGTALSWITMFKLIPPLPVIQTYIDRINARPSVIWAREKDAELAASHN
ncbi:MAG: glutathione S-transferase N-terminal domain-containing protein [Anaerolineae bacterium]|nr:glutathione S-transferase N-terminal domain-containing protein [Gloeobacterales cyanobacterium ES-bin-313]